MLNLICIGYLYAACHITRHSSVPNKSSFLHVVSRNLLLGLAFEKTDSGLKACRNDGGGYVIPQCRTIRYSSIPNNLSFLHVVSRNLFLVLPFEKTDSGSKDCRNDGGGYVILQGQTIRDSLMSITRDSSVSNTSRLLNTKQFVIPQCQITRHSCMLLAGIYF